MNNPRVEFLYLNTNILPQSEEIINSVKIRFDTKVDEYLRDPTGLQTLTRSYESSPPRLIEFRLPSGDNFLPIYEILCSHHDVIPRSRLSIHLTLFISHMAKSTGLGVNSSVLNLLVTLTYERVYDLGLNFSDLPVLIGGDDMVERLVSEGKIDEEISKSLGLEAEPCSICFENLKGTIDKDPTRMSCSHIFHDLCISQWLRRESSCPLCRRQVLYAFR